MCVSRVRFPALNLWLIFFVNGAVLASWAPRIPEVKHALSLSDSQLGIALLGVAGGSVPALLCTARMLRRLTPGRVSVVSALVFLATLPLISTSKSLLGLTTALAVAGAASGVLDVAMNTAGINYQQRCGLQILSRLHGGYSLGVLAGAGSAVIATSAKASVVEHFCVMAAALAMLVAIAAPALWQEPANDAVETTAQRVQPALLPTSIGVLAVCGLLIEGLITDWSALLITRDFGGPESWGAVGLTIFSVAMFISRSSGDVAIARLGERRLLVLSAASIVTAILLSIGTGDPLVMVLGIGIIGLVLGPLFPLAIARASRVAPGQEATMTARVSAVGYLAYLLGPPMIGAIADALGLPTTLGLIVCLACAGIMAAR